MMNHSAKKTTRCEGSRSLWLLGLPHDDYNFDLFEPNRAAVLLLKKNKMTTYKHRTESLCVLGVIPFYF
jgi:hypothetical protein